LRAGLGLDLKPMIKRIAILLLALGISGSPSFIFLSRRFWPISI
jgi:hypothetical protein